ncbi:MAG: hypothetical protein IKZ44_11095 [Clostridia bacterium]|nr:hypothetical protein [Clostridia bacterium]
MQHRIHLISLFLAFLLLLALAPTAAAEAADLPEKGDYVVRIDGGYVPEHTETVNGKECLRVDLFIDGVTNERLLSSISFKLVYDTDQLAYVKNKALSGNGAMSIGNPNEPGLFQFAFASSSGILISGNTPLLTLWFTVADDLPAGTQIRFAFAEAIKSDSVPQGSYTSQKRTVGAQLKPFGIAPIYGDANCDCEITAADAALVLRALVGLDTLSETGTENAKTAGQETYSAEDAALILRYIVGLIERFPAEE